MTKQEILEREKEQMNVYEYKYEKKKNDANEKIMIHQVMIK